MSKFRFRLSFLLVALVPLLVYFGWKKWSAEYPQALPQTSAIAKSTALFPGTYYETSVPPTGKAKYISAEYRLWVPGQVQRIRGVLVKQHGCGDAPASTGLDYANDLQWQALAVKHQLALLGAKLPTGKQLCDDWAFIDRGSEQAFFKALRTFGQKSQHPELETAPWVLWGHSAGSDWGIQLLQKYPDRVLAVVAARCGASTFPEKTNPAVSGIPVLFAVAAKENTLVDECRDWPKRVFFQYRKINAVWAIAEEVNTAHEAGDTRFLAIPYLDAMLAMRLPATGTKLRAISPTQGWLGNPATHAIAPIGQYTDDPLAAAWLPNEAVARKWQEYVTVGKISPDQPPAAPTQIQVTNLQSAAILSWHYTPDLTNGLPSFRIYRDQTLIKTLKGQRHNFSDAPEPPQVALEFQDQDSPSEASYTVAAFNEQGEQVSQPAPFVRNK